MNKKIIYSGLVALMLAGVSTSCTNNFEEINTDPNKMLVGQVKPYGLFEPILYGAADDWTYYSWFWNDELSQFTAFTGGTTREEHRYKITDANWKSVWNMYAEYAANAQHMNELAVANKEEATQAISKTIKVLMMSNLTDMYGDIPYKEAFTGRFEDGTITPEFESQKDVYLQIFQDLESANDIYATSPKFLKPAMDLMYGGDMNLWRKFNNSLYLRLLCRVSGRDEMQAGAKIKEILTNPEKYPIIMNNDENATVKLTGVDPYRNYFVNTTQPNFTTSTYKITEQLIKLTVKSENGVQKYIDPRLPIWGVMNNESWQGTVSGCLPEDRPTYDKGSAYLNYPVFCRGDAPVSFLEYSELQFIFAEAALNGWIDGGEAAAKEYYEAGVRASMQKWSPWGVYSKTPTSITGDIIDAYLQTPLASWDMNTNHKELIGNQKWLSLFWIGMEAYHEIRRTGYPELTIGKGTGYNDYQYPQRFGYSSVTVATNRENVQKALDRMGGENDMKTPVWWSKKAIGK